MSTDTYAETTYQFEVEVNTPNRTRVFPVEGWHIKGTTLVPIYDDGMTPSMEHPQTDVSLHRVRVTRVEGRNEPLFERVT